MSEPEKTVVDLCRAHEVLAYRTAAQLIEQVGAERAVTMLRNLAHAIQKDHVEWKPLECDEPHPLGGRGDE